MSGESVSELMAGVVVGVKCVELNAWNQVKSRDQMQLLCSL